VTSFFLEIVEDDLSSLRDEKRKGYTQKTDGTYFLLCTEVPAAKSLLVVEDDLFRHVFFDRL
jgi:hypothetical protein